VEFMPWWGWLLIVVAVAIIVPIKLKVLKSILEKRNKKDSDEEDSENY